MEQELETHPNKQSYRASVQETHSQYDSEVRSNAMLRNSERLRRISEQLCSLTEKSKVETISSSRNASTLYQADEVLAMLTTDELKSLHGAFVAKQGSLNFSEFVEV
jgi:hypothetical protein